MLRAVGMSRRQVRRMIRHESVITALLGAAFGIPLGILLAALIGATIELRDVHDPGGHADHVRDRRGDRRPDRRDLARAARRPAQRARSAPVRVAPATPRTTSTGLAPLGIRGAGRARPDRSALRSARGGRRTRHSPLRARRMAIRSALTRTTSHSRSGRQRVRVTRGCFASASGAHQRDRAGRVPDELALAVRACASANATCRPTRSARPAISISPLSARNALRKLTLISIEQMLTPAGRSDWTAQPRAESSSMQSRPPWTMPAGL